MTNPRQKVASRYNWRLWTVDAVSWDSDTRQSLRERVFAKRTERPKLTALGQTIESAQVRDREAAIALGHEFLDRFAHEARGTISVEIHISPPEKAVEEEREARRRRYKVSPEAIDQAKALGIGGDVEGQLQSMAFGAEPYAHPHANRRVGRFIMRVEHETLIWIALLDAPPGSIA